MTQATRRRHEHEALRAHIERIRVAAREIPTLSPGERKAVLARVVDFLHGTLELHVAEGERTLYPAIAGLLGDSQATETMALDHEAIRARSTALELADPADDARLQELLYGLHALISVHVWKEEVEYLPLLEKRELAPYVAELRLAG
jgi:iron-sulfur cluster repair protein YtfE (RIC family)